MRRLRKLLARLMWAIPGVFEPAGASAADYERHGNNKLNNGQHLFTLEEFRENTEEKCEATCEVVWKSSGIKYFVMVEQTDGAFLRPRLRPPLPWVLFPAASRARLRTLDLSLKDFPGCDDSPNQYDSFSKNSRMSVVRTATSSPHGQTLSEGFIPGGAAFGDL